MLPHPQLLYNSSGKVCQPPNLIMCEQHYLCQNPSSWMHESPKFKGGPQADLPQYSPGEIAMTGYELRTPQTGSHPSHQ